MITVGATIIGVGLASIGVAILEKSMYKQGKEHVGHIINTTTKTILIVGGLGGAIIVLIHAVGRLL